MAVSTHASNALSEDNFKFTQNYAHFLAIADPLLDSFNIYFCVILRTVADYWIAMISHVTLSFMLYYVAKA